MKRRAKFSLKRNSQKLKKPHIVDSICQPGVPENQGLLNKGPQTVSGFVASLSASSNLDTAATRDGDSRPELAPVGHSNDDFLDEATSDCVVDHPTDPMSCEPVSVCDANPGSGHQMESERRLEECRDTGDAIPSSNVSCNSNEESGLEEVDFITDPTPESDLCTHYDDLSNPSVYALSSDDVAQFEDFSMPHTHRTQANPSVKRQTSLLSFISRTSSTNSKFPPTPSMSSDSKQQIAGTSSANTILPTGKGGKGKGTNRMIVQGDTGSQVSVGSDRTGTNGRVKRTCPFYKRIPGIVISVYDWYCFGVVTLALLSHRY